MTSTESPPQQEFIHRSHWQHMRVRVALAASVALLFIAAPAQAQTLRDAVERAWERQPAAQAQAFRAAEVAARVKAANAWVPAPPSVGLSERSDRFNRNAGAREVETALSVPLWLPGQRQRESALAAAEQDLQRDALDSAKWKLAGEVREAYWQARAAEAERAAAVRRLDDAVALSADVERRLKAGDLARTDFNRPRAPNTPPAAPRMRPMPERCVPCWSSRP